MTDHPSATLVVDPLRAAIEAVLDEARDDVEMSSTALWVLINQTLAAHPATVSGVVTEQSIEYAIRTDDGDIQTTQWRSVHSSRTAWSREEALRAEKNISVWTAVSRTTLTSVGEWQPLGAEESANEV